ncbi:hypothetical protein [Fontibacillus sp. BL9]|uniref:hypothetical protein n=1 Tax=Fontibacillus sp. BL9 TaxID=3389971 RepID=UPI00397CFF12
MMRNAEGKAQVEKTAEQNQKQEPEEQVQKKVQDWSLASYYLPDAAWLVSRHQSKAGAFGFAAKSGNNGEPHNHNDLGHFILYGQGEIYAADLGSGEYTADYFGDGRYGYDCNGSQGHSVPIIDGKYQREGPDHSSTVLRASAAADRDELTLELSGAYRVEGLQRLVRSMVWHKEEWPRLELTDEYRYAGTPECWTERFATWRRPETVRPGMMRIPGTTGSGVEIQYDGQILEPDIARHVYRGHFGRETVWHSIDFHVSEPGEEERFSFVFQFVPLD